MKENHLLIQRNNIKKINIEQNKDKYGGIQKSLNRVGVINKIKELWERFFN